MRVLTYSISFLLLIVLCLPVYADRKYHGVYYHPDGWDAWVSSMDGCVFYSYDDGQTWNLKECPTESDLFDIYMTSFFGGTGDGWAVGLNGDIQATTDGGNNWFRQEYGLSKYLTRIECSALDDTIAWVAGGDGIVVRTGDLGNSWEAIFTNLNTDFWGISFLDSLEGWTVGGRIYSEEPGGRGFICHTTDGGYVWTVDPAMVDTGPGAQPGVNDYMDVKFIDDLTGWVVGGDDISNSPFAVKTEDGGATWDTLAVSGSGILRGVDFINENEGWAVGEFGIIVHTTDGGQTWEEQSSGTRAHLFDVDFIDETKGIIPGDSCLILYTDDGGDTWAPAEVRFYFIRGDLNADSTLTMADAIGCLQHLYVPGADAPACLKAADLDDNSEITMSDAITLLKVIYVPGTPDPPQPFPNCGWDPTPDGLCCDEHPCM